MRYRFKGLKWFRLKVVARRRLPVDDALYLFCLRGRQDTMRWLWRMTAPFGHKRRRRQDIFATPVCSYMDVNEDGTGCYVRCVSSQALVTSVLLAWQGHVFQSQA